MSYKLGNHSVKELRGVHPDLRKVVHRAIEITEQDFTVHDGLRTKDEQREMVRRRVSRTMKSKHLCQKKDGYGHAVDLVPYINGKLRWEMEACYVIAEAVKQAAEELGVKIRWGACWQRIDGSSVGMELMVEEYIAKRRRQGVRPFVDGPHFEIVV